MINKKMFKSAFLITAVMLSVTGCSGGCGKQAEPAIADSPVATAEPEESLESIEPTPSPTATPTAKPVEESMESEEVVPSEEVKPSEEVVPSEEIISSEEVEPDLGYEIISTDDTTYYALQTCNLRSGPGTDYDKIGSLTYTQEIVCNGRVESGTKIWLVLKTDNDEVQMVSASLVSRDKPQQQQPSGNNGSSGQQDNSGNQGSQQQQQQPPADDGQGVGGGALAGLPVITQDEGSGNYDNFDIE
ncbi:MAG: SH3 domain-containing protein [Muribaculum sp.]|nr:SH3 domain-containing protein [Muribaculum sp.]